MGARPALGDNPLGVVTTTTGGDPGRCPAGHACTAFSITACPGGERKGYYAVSPAPAGTDRGMIALFSGGAGTLYWAEDNADQAALVSRLHQQRGLWVVQVRWAANWQLPSNTETPGPDGMACRPATILHHLYEVLYEPLAIDAPLGVCGFCAGGVSGASAEVAYSLSHYGLDRELDGAFPVSGPTHAAIAKGCRRDIRAEDAYWYSGGGGIDPAYGYTSNGPCQTHNVSWVPTWERDSVDGQGSDYRHDTTRVHLILGQADTVQRTRAQDYVRRLSEMGSPMVEVQIVPGMAHALNPDGVTALEGALTWQSTHGMRACDNGLDDDGDGLADAPADPGCSRGSDISERQPGGDVCDDGVDQDGDGRADAPGDAGCTAPADSGERQLGVACDDGVDQDGDGRADFPADIGCSSITDTSGAGSPERDASYPCDNGLDDDGDGKIDHASSNGDPQCTTPETPSETGSGAGGSTITIGTKTVNEGAPGTTAYCRIRVSLAPSSAQSATVDYATADGTAVAGSDYVAASGRVRFPPGATSKTLKLTVIGDATVEPAEYFDIVLSRPVGAALGASRGTCYIGNDDPA